MLSGFSSRSAAQTRALGERLGLLARPGWIVGLEGDLGAGKTTLVQGLVAGLEGDSSLVTSPTFTLLQEYEGRLPVYHFDLYRLETYREAEDIGFREFAYGQGVAVIEWFDKFEELWPDTFLRVTLHTTGETTRDVSIETVGEWHW